MYSAFTLGMFTHCTTRTDISHWQSSYILCTVYTEQLCSVHCALGAVMFCALYIPKCVDMWILFISGVQCLPQRSALLKSILNFFKKVIPEPTLSFADSIRHIMEGTLPKALQHIISNAEYYGASLFLLGKLNNCNYLPNRGFMGIIR